MMALVTDRHTQKISQRSQYKEKTESTSALEQTFMQSGDLQTLQCKDGCACGGGCPICREDTPIQSKLRIGRPNDKYEQEADHVANQVMRMPETDIRRQPT